jgi:hypothetical protein
MNTPRRSRRLQGLSPEPFITTESTQNENEGQPIWSLFLISVAIASIPVFFALVD